MIINIYSSLEGVSNEEVEEEFRGKNYGEFKRNVADVVCEFLERIQKRYHELVDSEEIEEILRNGANEVRELAKKKYEVMRKQIGLYR